MLPGKSRFIDLIKKITSKFWELEIFSAGISSIVLILYVIFSLFQAEKLLFLTQIVAILGTLFDISWFFRGIEDFKKVVFSNIFIKLLAFIMIVLFINDKTDLLLYFIIQGSSNFLSQIVLWAFLFKYIPFSKVKISGVISNLKPSLAYFVPKIANQAFLNLNKTLLGILSTMASVGIFSSSYTIVNLGANIMNSLSEVILPRMSNMLHEGKEKEGMLLLNEMLHLQLFMTVPIMFGIIGINPKMIDWFFGASFRDLLIIVPLMAPLVILQPLHNFVATAYLIPRGEIKSYNISVIQAAIFSTILALIFIPVFDIYGAVISVVGGYGLLTFLRIYILLKKTTFKFGILKLAKFFISGIIMSLSIFIIGVPMKSSSTTTLLQVSLGIIIYMGLTTLLKANPIAKLVLANQDKG